MSVALSVSACSIVSDGRGTRRSLGIAESYPMRLLVGCCSAAACCCALTLMLAVSVATASRSGWLVRLDCCLEYLLAGCSSSVTPSD